jgi:hypothetical protein
MVLEYVQHTHVLVEYSSIGSHMLSTTLPEALPPNRAPDDAKPYTTQAAANIVETGILKAPSESHVFRRSMSVLPGRGISRLGWLVVANLLTSTFP